MRVLISSESHHFNPRGPRGTATHSQRIIQQCRAISIHAAREGPRHVISFHVQSLHIFQSTRPARDRDTALLINSLAVINFNPRGPRGTATTLLLTLRLGLGISIHAAREGPRRGGTRRGVSGFQHFNPRGPRGTATRLIGERRGTGFISIHAAREGPRLIDPDAAAGTRRISIHAAREGPRRRHGITIDENDINFNPRGPRGTATPLKAADMA